MHSPSPARGRRACRPIPCRAAVLSIAVALVAPARASADAWSPSVDGLRARLIATTYQDDQRRAQVRVELELENTSDRGSPIELTWRALDDMVGLTLEDASGAPIPEAHPGGNSISPLPFTLALPHASTLRVTLSRAAVEYVPSGKVLLRPFALVAWSIARPTGLALRGTLALAHPGSKPGARPTVLALPRIHINGGRRGYLVGVDPAVLRDALGGKPVSCAI